MQSCCGSSKTKLRIGLDMSSSFVKGVLSGSALSLTCCAAIYSFLNSKENEQRQLSSHDDNILLVTEDVDKLTRSRSALKYGIPNRGPHTRCYSDHVLAYDQARKIPVWVAEHLHRDKLTGSANRKKSHFKPDPDVDKRFSAVNEDYWKSGWSRGHMAPAGNYKYDQTSMNETFYLSNILPQDLDNNAGFWNRFEIFCRDLTKKYQDVRVISGPVTLPETAEDGKRYVRYQVIGQGEVAVPGHLFKVIVAENDYNPEKKYVGAFIVPNKPIGFRHQLGDFQVDLDYLEGKSGITFLPRLEKSQHLNLCEYDGCELMSHDKFELYMAGRRIASARNIQNLEKSWSEFKVKKVKPDDYLLSLYENKKNELAEKEQKRSEL